MWAKTISAAAIVFMMMMMNSQNGIAAPIEVARSTKIFQSRAIRPINPRPFGIGQTRTTADSMELVARYWFPADPVANPPTGLFIIGTHGLRESTLQRDAFAEKLVQEGFIVAGFDLPGHGASPNMGQAQNERDALLPPLDSLSQEVRLFIQATQERYRPRFGNLPTIAYGHSVGGAIVADAVLMHRNLPAEENRLIESLHLAGTIVSHPGLKPFGFQKPLVPILRASNWLAPRAPLFALPNFGFVSGDYAGREEFERGSPAKLPDSFVVGGVPRVSRETESERKSYRGQLHPTWTAVRIFNADQIRTDRVEIEPFTLDSPIVFIHPPQDLTTNAQATLRFATQGILSSKEIVIDRSGRHAHGEVDDDIYLQNVIGFATAMRDGAAPSVYQPWGARLEMSACVQALRSPAPGGNIKIFHYL